jgi:hypothetical protein
MRSALTSSEPVHLVLSSEAAAVFGVRLEIWCTTSLFWGAIWNSGVQFRCFWAHLEFWCAASCFLGPFGIA